MKIFETILLCAIAMLFLGGTARSENEHVQNHKGHASIKDSVDQNLRIIDSNIHEINLNEDLLRYKREYDTMNAVKPFLYVPIISKCHLRTKDITDSGCDFLRQCYCSIGMYGVSNK